MDFQGLAKQGLQGLRDIQRTGGEAGKMAGDIARTNLQGTQAAESMAQRLALAQGGVEGGAASAAQARLNRQAGLQTAGLEGQLAVDQAARSERASNTLAQLGMQGLSLEETARQFDANFGLSKDKFMEDNRRYGLDYALREAATNTNIAATQADAALAAGDLEAFGQIWNNAGVAIDTGKMLTKQQNEQLGNSLGNFTDYINNNPDADLNDPVVMQDLTSAWEAMGKDPTDPAFNKWAQDRIDTARTMADPYARAVAALTDDTLDAMITANTDSPADWNYKGVGGAQGMRNAITAALATGGIGMENGEINFDNDAIRAIFGDDIADDAEEFVFVDDMNVNQLNAEAAKLGLKIKADDFNNLDDFKTAVKNAKAGTGGTPTTPDEIPVSANGIIAKPDTEIPQDIKDAVKTAWDDNPTPSFDDAQRAVLAGALKPTGVASLPTGEAYKDYLNPEMGGNPSGFVAVGNTVYQLLPQTATGKDDVFLAMKDGTELRYHKPTNQWVIDGLGGSKKIPDPSKMTDEERSFLPYYVKRIKDGTIVKPWKEWINTKDDEIKKGGLQNLNLT